MSKRYTKLFHLLLICVFTSCGAQNTKKDTADFSGFLIEKKLIEKKLISLGAIKPSGLLLYQDSLIIIRNRTGTNPDYFIGFSILQNKITTSLLPSGRKPGQSLGFLSYGLLKNAIWVNDIVKEKLIIIPLVTDTLDKINAPVEEYNLSAFYYSVQMLNDSMMIGAGNYDSDFKIAITNVLKDSVAEKIIPYNLPGETPTPREDKMAYESFLYVKPKGEKCVLACRYADLIEITDLKSKTSKIIHGPEKYKPDVLVAMGNDGKMLSTRNEDTRFAFLTGKTTDSAIYLLYSGHNHLSSHKDYGNYVYIYDWDGKPLKKSKFSEDVAGFCVSKDNKTIYAYHPGSNTITISKL